MSNPLYNIALHSYAVAARLAAIPSPKVREKLRGQRDCRDSHN